MKQIKVCFVSLRSYPLFAKNSAAYFGGAEVQISLIAKELAKDSRFKVGVIVGDYGQKNILKSAGVTLFKTKKYDFLNILRQTDADVYIERTINPKIFIVGLWCRWFRKKFIYMMAHDWDANHHRLRLASTVICQSHNQKKLLRKKLGINGKVMYPIVFLEKKRKLARLFHLWVGRADTWKRPQDFIGLARRYPHERFVMVCRPGNNHGLFNTVKKSVQTLGNIRSYEAVPPKRILGFFRRAKTLVNTSLAEGWPNTFLQAGATATPVISFRINPDNYLTAYRCGRVSSKLIKFNPAAGSNHRSYVRKFHHPDNINVLKRILCKL